MWQPMSNQCINWGCKKPKQVFCGNGQIVGEKQEDLRLFFSEPPVDCRDWRTASTCNKGHGRLERRELVATTELNDLLARTWTCVAQVFRLSRKVEREGKAHQEVVYGLTNLPCALASDQDLLQLQREHWAIENRLHHR
jgi:hypothetical protein